MKLQLSILFLCVCLLTGCKNSIKNINPTLEKIDSGLGIQQIEPSPFDIMDELSSHMNNKVNLDNFTRGITNQKSVRLVTQLKEQWNDTTKVQTYSSGNYNFQLKIVDQSTTITDGESKIEFNDYSTEQYFGEAY